MKKLIAMVGILLLPSCGTESVKQTNDVVLLIRKGEIKKSEVVMYGVYCTASWYRSIEHLIIRRNGTIIDTPFEYKWTLNELNSDADKIWFDKNCKEAI